VVKPPLRTKTLSTKVSEAELAQLEAAASERGLTLSEWFRETLLASVNGQESKASDPGGTGHAVMAEVMALRAILLNVMFKLANGQPLNAEEMQRLIDRADSDKLGKARERLWQAQESEGQRKEKS
jgi:mobilization protein NikA